MEELLAAHPNLAEALINMAMLHVDKEEFIEAKKYLQEAVDKNPNHYLANAEFGKFLNQMGEEKKGLEYLKKSSEINPGDWAVHVHLGNSYQEAGYFDEAIASFEKALELNPNELGTRQNLSRALSRFVPPWHLKMLADHERNDDFEAAIKKAVGPDSIVLDIGTGSGILSMMAARHGAKDIYTCETSSHIARVAEKIIDKNGYADRIKVFNLKSTQLTENELHKKPNLIIAEIFDAGLIGEMAISTFRHALDKLCAEGCKIVPARAEVVGRLLHTPNLFSVNPLHEISGFDLSPFDRFRIPKEYVSQDLNQVEYEFLSEEFHMIEYDFANLHGPIPDPSFDSREIKVQVSKPGQLHGVAFWFNLWLDDEIMHSSHPQKLNNHWGQALYFFEQGKDLTQGQEVNLVMCHNDMKIWFEEPQIS